MPIKKKERLKPLFFGSIGSVPEDVQQATPSKRDYGCEALLSSQFKAPRPAAAPVANEACSR
jgi:hypothetical protein